DKGGIATALHNLAYVAQYRREYEEAAARFAESLAMFQEQGDQLGIAWSLAGLAGILAMQGQAVRAARLFSATAAALDAIGAVLSPTDRAEFDRSLALVRRQLDEVEFAAAWAEGQAMTLEQSVAYTMDKICAR
ncbi:MAG: tetratricopeptide repeat protein, partial [Chloroflexota bacterium]|nr:tetratricopeptide repeat protein [Chloroflexota bacterium]